MIQKHVIHQFKAELIFDLKELRMLLYKQNKEYRKLVESSVISLQRPRFYGGSAGNRLTKIHLWNVTKWGLISDIDLQAIHTLFDQCCGACIPLVKNP